MSASRRILPFAALLLPVLLVACQGGGKQEEFAWQPLFGDNFNDTTPVVARVAGVEITEQDIDLRLDELPPNIRNRYSGAEGRHLLLKDMVNQVLMVRGAVDLELYNQREVARTLISQRRSTLEMAMRGVGLLEKAQPTEEDLQAYFAANRSRYRQLGSVMAQHIECDTRADAQAAYERLQRGGLKNAFPYVVADYSVNAATRQKSGELGWFNPGGFVPDIVDGKHFTTVAYGLRDGLNPPVEIGGRWHVIEILRRENERPMTFAEARDQVKQEVMPGFQEGVVQDYLRQARVTYPVETYGDYAPGGGLTAEQVFARAMALPDGENKLDMFMLVVSDFPQSDRVDDALFMAAQVYLDLWGDRKSAARCLSELTREHPQSELVDDATYLLENLDNPAALNPQSIEELRR